MKKIIEKLLLKIKNFKKWIKRKIKKFKKSRKENKIIKSNSTTTMDNSNNINLNNGNNISENNTSLEDKKIIRTFTKKWVDIILTISLIDVQMVFILAFCGMDQIAETLGVAIVTEIIGVFISYAIKAYLESYSSEKNKLELEKERMKHEYTISNDDNDIQDDVVVDDDIV